MQITNILTGIAVKNVDAALDYYERLFGRPADARPMPILADWHLPAGFVQLVADPGRAGQSLLTLQVDDLDATLSELAERGITPTTADTQSGETVNFAMLNDPEGTMITLVQLRAS